MKLKEKIYKIALISDRIERLSLEEKNKIIVELLKKKTQKEIADEIGVSETTVYDWKTKRRIKGCDDYHVSLSLIIRKLEKFIIKDSDDTIKLIQIKTLIEKKLRGE